LKKTKLIYYFTPLLLAVLMFFSNFLNSEMFKSGFQSFTVWFVLSVFAFACGWLINKTLNWIHGGRILFAVIVAASFISVLIVSFFSDYFGVGVLLSEDMILYTLRNVTLGAMGFFGMAISEVIIQQKEVHDIKQALEKYQSRDSVVKKEAELILREAATKAEKLIFEAEKKANEHEQVKKHLEKQIREFIIAERELLKRYEED